MYGPTETTIWSSVDRIISADQISLGLPIANTQFYVLMTAKTCAPGNCGELRIGGEGLAQGYLKRPELTAEKFIAIPNGGRTSSRLYRTGDEVRYRPEGTLEFLGRLDHQVKLHGFRIELGEIECALANIEGISQAAVILREDRPGDKRLVAYYTGRDDLSSTALRESLKTTLPDYMVPSAFVRLEQFPLHLMRSSIARLLPNRRSSDRFSLKNLSLLAPHEKQLAALWCELLQLDEIGIDDSFFELGGIPSTQFAWPVNITPVSARKFLRSKSFSIRRLPSSRVSWMLKKPIRPPCRSRRSRTPSAQIAKRR